MHLLMPLLRAHIGLKTNVRVANHHQTCCTWAIICFGLVPAFQAMNCTMQANNTVLWIGGGTSRNRFTDWTPWLATVARTWELGGVTERGCSVFLVMSVWSKLNNASWTKTTKVIRFSPEVVQWVG